MFLNLQHFLLLLLTEISNGENIDEEDASNKNLEKEKFRSNDHRISVEKNVLHETQNNANRKRLFASDDSSDEDDMLQQYK